MFLTDAVGTVVSEYAYDAYGRALASFETVANPHLYTAREFDPESGLYRYRVRAYGPRPAASRSSAPSPTPPATSWVHVRTVTADRAGSPSARREPVQPCRRGQPRGN